MLIKNFINEVINELQYDDLDIRNFILKTALYNATEKVLQFLKYHEKEYIVSVDSSLKIKLPAEIYSINKIYLDGVEIYRTNNPVPEVGFYFIESEYNSADYKTALKLKKILSINIKNLRSRETEGYKIEFFDINDNSLGLIYDNENIFFKEANLTKEAQIKLFITEFDDVIRIKEDDILEVDTGVGILSITLPAVSFNETTYYIAEDGTLYSDVDLTILAWERNKFKFKTVNFLIGGGKEEQEVKIKYLANPVRHINVYEDDEFLDLYQTAILYFTVSACYKFMKKYKDARQYLDDANVELLRLKKEISFKREQHIDRRVGRLKERTSQVYF